MIAGALYGFAAAVFITASIPGDIGFVGGMAIGFTCTVVGAFLGTTFEDHRQ